MRDKNQIEISEMKLCQIYLRGKFNKLCLAEERISYLEDKAEETFQNAPLRVKDMENIGDVEWRARE